MNRKMSLLLAAGALMTVAPSIAFAEATVDTQTKIERDDSGGYKSTTETTKTDNRGTTGKAEETVKIEKNSDGSVEKSRETKSSVDPKGLFNKSTESTLDETVTDKDGNKVKQHYKKEMNGKTVLEETEKK